VNVTPPPERPGTSGSGSKHAIALSSEIRERQDDEFELIGEPEMREVPNVWASFNPYRKRAATETVPRVGPRLPMVTRS
jgi:hypothetical protein